METEEDGTQPKGMIEAASSGRSKCRGCGTAIAKGELRLGDQHPNPFGDGEVTYWFHLECGAYRRPETFVAVVGGDERHAAAHAQLLAVARAGVEHPRLTRLARLEPAPSGRARCRQCRETIDKGELRLALDIFQDGRFDPIGFVHLSCQRDYFGASVSVDRLVRAAGLKLDQATIDSAIAQLAGERSVAK